MKTSLIRKSNAGFALAASLVILVICSVFGVFFTKMFLLGQEDAARDGLGAQAIQAARAGADYAAYQSLRSNSCTNSTVVFVGLSSFNVFLTCSTTTTSEAGASVVIDAWTIVACNSTSCPGTASAGYVERQMKIVLAK